MTVTAEQLAEWRALADKATPGPWRALHKPSQPENGATLIYVTSPGGGGNCLLHVVEVTWPLPDGGTRTIRQANFKSRPDADFVEAARAAVPALLAEVERLRAEVDRLGRRVAFENLRRYGPARESKDT